MKIKTFAAKYSTPPQHIIILVVVSPGKIKNSSSYRICGLFYPKLHPRIVCGRGRFRNRVGAPNPPGSAMVLLFFVRFIFFVGELNAFDTFRRTTDAYETERSLLLFIAIPRRDVVIFSFLPSLDELPAQNLLKLFCFSRNIVLAERVEQDCGRFALFVTRLQTFQPCQKIHNFTLKTTQLRTNFNAKLPIL